MDKSVTIGTGERIEKFFRYVELKTKITSTFTFVYILGYMLYQKTEIHAGKTALFGISMFLFDLTTTAVNNYIDSKGNGPGLPYTRRKAKLILYGLLLASTATGLLLALWTDLVVLAAGGICFLFGIFYTFGPIPISRQPLGEILSGFFYGFMIPLIMLQINGGDNRFISYALSMQNVSVTVAVRPAVHLIILSVIPFCVTANIMLANNTCDVKKDILVKRFTLPYYIGTAASIRLFALLYAVCYGAAFVLAFAKIMPYTILLILVTIPFVWRQIRIFSRQQDKKKTFICSIRCFIMLMGAAVIGTYAGLLI